MSEMFTMGRGKDVPGYQKLPEQLQIYFFMSMHSRPYTRRGPN